MATCVNNHVLRQAAALAAIGGIHGLYQTLIPGRGIPRHAYALCFRRPSEGRAPDARRGRRSPARAGVLSLPWLSRTGLSRNDRRFNRRLALFWLARLSLFAIPAQRAAAPRSSRSCRLAMLLLPLPGQPLKHRAGGLKLPGGTWLNGNACPSPGGPPDQPWRESRNTSMKIYHINQIKRNHLPARKPLRPCAFNEPIW